MNLADASALLAFDWVRLSTEIVCNNRSFSLPGFERQDYQLQMDTSRKVAGSWETSAQAPVFPSNS